LQDIFGVALVAQLKKVMYIPVKELGVGSGASSIMVIKLYISL